MVVSPSNFSVRGFHLDLRIQVMKPAALHQLADELAELNFNTLVMEWESSFPYRKNATISHALAYRTGEIRHFLRHCQSLGLTIIPLQQSLGHLEYVLRHPRYAALREDSENLCQLCPRKLKAARPVLRSLLEDLREYHDGPYIHLGGDEAYLLGHCPTCRAYVRKHGLSRLYAECMREVIAEAKALGWRPIIWADMLLKHPACLDLLPKDTILVNWNYGWDRDRFGSPDNLRARRFTVWGAPALRSAPDNHSLTWWSRHLQNFKTFLPQSIHDNYAGIVLTSWSTSGQYGYERDGATGEDVLDLLPIRRVYPLNGHRLLLVAFADALRDPTGFSPTEFLSRYAANRFGLKAEDQSIFVSALLAQTPEGTPSGKRLAALRPRRNGGEFAHLQLIEQFHWLQFATQEVMARFNHFSYTSASAPILFSRVTQLVTRSNRLEVAYRRRQQGYLNPKEISVESGYRRKALLNLRDTLKKQLDES